MLLNDKQIVMESKIQTKVKLNRIENILYFIIVAAITIDVLVKESNTILLIASTSVLIAGVLGIVGIEWVKLQLRQRG